MYKSIEDMFMDEFNKKLVHKLADEEHKVSTHILERDEYCFTLGRIAALRECKEELKTLIEKFFHR